MQLVRRSAKPATALHCRRASKSCHCGKKRDGGELLETWHFAGLALQATIRQTEAGLGLHRLSRTAQENSW